MKSFVTGLAAASLIIGMAAAQTTTPGTTSGTVVPGTTIGSGTTSPNTGSGVAAASGNNNQAVATTAANAPMPAKGKNSFTMNQARSRIQAKGFAQVVNLKKDNDGIWRGKGQKDGSSVNVWVDYKGNVGQQ